MKCISCETEINPKWEHAIEINVCPFCGKHIMEEHLKNCLTGLAAAMKDMQKYPEQLDDWLLSNHSYIKTTSPNLINYLSKDLAKEAFNLLEPTRTSQLSSDSKEPKVSTMKIKLPGGGTQEILVEKTQSEEQTNSFFERAEVLKGAGKTSGKAPKSPDEPEAPKSVIEKTQNLKSVAQQIRREISSGTASENSLASMMESADPEAVAEFQAVISSGDIIASGLPDPSTGDDDDIPPAALAMARMANSKNSEGANEKDLKTLQEMQNKVQNAQKRLASGKGGFSRA